ncbi:MAG: hypothetical protein HRU20_28640 [Pseudomonadales bacterium]|nr:hypothetical protein [Pseudomonadales bacterium]
MTTKASIKAFLIQDEDICDHMSNLNGTKAPCEIVGLDEMKCEYCPLDNDLKEVIRGDSS